MNLTEEMRKLAEAERAQFSVGKTNEQIADETAFIAECEKRNPFSAQYLNCTKAMRLYTLAPDVAVRLKAEAEISRDDRIAALEKAVRAMGGTVDHINEKIINEKQED